MTPEQHAEIVGRLSAVELAVAQCLALMLSGIPDADEMELSAHDFAIQHERKLGELPPASRQAALATALGITASALTTAKGLRAALDTSGD